MKDQEGTTRDFQEQKLGKVSLWHLLFEIDDRKVWYHTEKDTGKKVYQMTEGKEPLGDGGYYKLYPLLQQKNL